MALREDCGVDAMVAFLNELASLDPGAALALVNARVPCNEAVGDHPTLQVSMIGSEEPGGLTVGLLGVLNGFYRRPGEPGQYGPIAAAVPPLAPGERVRFMRKES